MPSSPPKYIASIEVICFQTMPSLSVRMRTLEGSLQLPFTRDTIRASFRQMARTGPFRLFLAFPGQDDLSLAIYGPDMVRQFIRLEHVAFSPFFRSLQMLVQGLDGMLSIHKGADHSRWLSPMLQMNGLASAPRLASLKSQFLP